MVAQLSSSEQVESSVSMCAYVCLCVSPSLCVCECTTASGLQESVDSSGMEQDGGVVLVSTVARP